MTREPTNVNVFVAHTQRTTNGVCWKHDWLSHLVQVAQLSRCKVIQQRLPTPQPKVGLTAHNSPSPHTTSLREQPHDPCKGGAGTVGLALWGWHGPDKWCDQFPIAAGKHQSPIDIKRSICTQDTTLKPITVNYDSVEVGELGNTGSSWKAQVTGGKSSLTGGPLSSCFALEQFHAHWSCSEKVGSEHTIDGTSYAAELHLVHWDTGKYKSFGEAASEKGGLAVLGMFIKVGKANDELDKLTKLMAFIPYKNQTVNINEKIDCLKFLPKNRSYFTYDGSLTTPPCYESVNWIVFEEPIEVSAAQLSAFRSLKSYTKNSPCPCDELKGCMVDNFRPCCPLNDRTVRVFKEGPQREE
ncbi:Alpha carbonic anhydrase [Trinorchestia longiramus]|nr:Alpha carbonic anhydrase [Trinorchestia longiramus]